MIASLSATSAFLFVMFWRRSSSLVVAEVLYALKEYDMAFVYWNLALQKNTEDGVPGLKAKVERKKAEVGR